MFSRKLLPHLLLAVSLSIVAVLAFQVFSADKQSYHRGFCEGLAPEECVSSPYLQTSAEEALARKYSPIVYLPRQISDCDTNAAAFPPIAVEAVLNNPRVALRKVSDTEYFKAAPSATDLFLVGASKYFDAYLDFPGHPDKPGCRYERDGRRLATEQPAVTYARIAFEEGHDGLVLQYWFFYYFNRWNNKHEGDWEMIQLHFEAESPREALRLEPMRIALSQHSGGEVASWSDTKVRREGNHPIVHVAAGSQANFFAPGLYVGRGDQGTGLGCDDASTPGRRLELEVRLLPNVVKGPTDPYAWLAFKGYWGELAGYDSDGSTAPVTKQRWLYPLTWENNLRGSSVALPGETVGPNAVRAFCDFVAFGSNFLLPVYRELPMVSVLTFAALSLGFVGSLTRTRYMPLRIWPLRARRRMGQVLTSAMEVYRSHAYVFLSLGLLSFPVGLLATAVHKLVQSAWPGGIGLQVTDGSFVQKLVSAFALSELHFGLTYALVIAASTAVVGRLERNQQVDSGLALRDLLQHLPKLLVPRLFAVLVVIGLGMTVIGIPVALYLALRWTFMEQAVLLDGRAGKSAMDASARAVSAKWWWSAAAIVSLGLLVTLLAPALGIVLIMALKATPLGYVNLVTSAVYAILVPYVAIALSLVYFDLNSRRASS